MELLSHIWQSSNLDNFINREVTTTITLKNEEKVALFLRNRYFLYIRGGINDVFGKYNW